jgi:hypothetical protein
MLSPPLGPKQPGGASHCDLHDLLADRRRDRLVVLFQALEIALDGIADVGKRLVSGRTLGDAARQCRTLSDKDSILVLLDDDLYFMREIVSHWLDAAASAAD